MAKDVGATNAFKTSDLKAFISRIEAKDKELLDLTIDHMNAAREVKEDRKEIFAEAKDKGIPVKALKAELKLRSLDRDKAKVVAGLEEDDRETLEMIQDALGDLASTPLGSAAMNRSGASA